MEYRVRWIEDNLGITRKTLQKYEEAGLIPDNKKKAGKKNTHLPEKHRPVRDAALH